MAKSIMIAGLLVFAFANTTLAQVGIVSDIKVPGTLTANTKTDFYVTLNQNPNTTGLTGVVTIVNAASNDVNSLEFWNGSQWANMPLLVSTANELSASNSFIASSMSFKVSFRAAKQYIIGYSLYSNGQVISSTAYPVTVQGDGQVLGESKHAFNTNLRYGMRNNDVKELQPVLKAQNYFKVNPTGYFGPITLGAVKKYQAHNGLPSTGFVGPLTRAKLNQ